MLQTDPNYTFGHFSPTRPNWLTQHRPTHILPRHGPIAISKGPILQNRSKTQTRELSSSESQKPEEEEAHTNVFLNRPSRATARFRSQI